MFLQPFWKHGIQQMDFTEPNTPKPFNNVSSIQSLIHSFINSSIQHTFRKHLLCAKFKLGTGKMELVSSIKGVRVLDGKHSGREVITARHANCFARRMP